MPDRLAFDGAPTTNPPLAACDQCGTARRVYHRSEPGRTPSPVGVGPWRLVPHQGRRGGRYVASGLCVMSDREPSSLAAQARRARPRGDVAPAPANAMSTAFDGDEAAILAAEQ